MWVTTLFFTFYNIGYNSEDGYKLLSEEYYLPRQLRTRRIHKKISYFMDKETV